LIPRSDSEERIAAFEVMVATPAIRTLIRDGKTHQLYKDIQTGADLGMQTLDGALLRLLKEKRIDYEHALAKTSNPADFQKRAINAGLVEVSDAKH
jgi:twitching motility protein PilT